MAARAAAPEDIEHRREVSVYCLDPGADDFLGPVLAAVNAAEPALYAYTLHDPDADMETRISTLAALYASGEGPELICLGGIDRWTTLAQAGLRISTALWRARAA